jgi:hypothetical protein
MEDPMKTYKLTPAVTQTPSGTLTLEARDADVAVRAELQPGCSGIVEVQILDDETEQARLTLLAAMGQAWPRSTIGTVAQAAAQRICYLEAELLRYPPRGARIPLEPVASDLAGLAAREAV